MNTLRFTIWTAIVILGWFADKIPFLSFVENYLDPKLRVIALFGSFAVFIIMSVVAWYTPSNFHSYTQDDHPKIYFNISPQTITIYLIIVFAIGLMWFVGASLTPFFITDQIDRSIPILLIRVAGGFVALLMAHLAAGGIYFTITPRPESGTRLEL